ncbi:MAG: SDR family oxidoreductase [Desulfarculus sp.]|nr:SDR family oxidoreductase [Desulfarculus sp.]
MLETGQTLIITGSSRGIGRALALGLAQQGLNLVLNARQEGPLQEVAEQCRCGRTNVASLAGNAAQDQVALGLVEMALGMGGFLGFIHAAAVLHPGPYLWEYSARQQAEVLDSILLGGANLVRHAVPNLLEAGQGLAIFMSSESVVGHTPGLGLYALANTALEFLMRQLAAETQVVTTFLFCPAAVDTRLQRDGREAQGGAAHVIRPIFHQYHEQGLLMTPEQSAEALISVLNSPWRWLHGQEVDARKVLSNGVATSSGAAQPVCPVSFQVPLR